MEHNPNVIFEYHDLIEAIVLALERRDIHTLHHSRRVSDMTEYICRVLALSPTQTEYYHLAADLHDIGKIGVSDAVLLKAGKLSETEWQEMRSHAATGSEILSKVERFQSIAKVVRHHHERWDGQGYPDGLAGDAIPHGSRIIAVADSIDAMLSNRCYRGAMTTAVCKAEIKKNLGIMYDPRIGQIVLDHWNAIMAVRQNCGKYFDA